MGRWPRCRGASPTAKPTSGWRKSSSAPPAARRADGPPMIGALFYLRLTSLRNLISSRLRRLKQPKYLVGAIVGAAYFYLMFFRRMSAGRPSVHSGVASQVPAVLPADYLP